MSRAGLLPTVGEPMLLLGWLNLYKKYIQQDIDRLYITIPKLHGNNHSYLEKKFKEVNAIIIPTPQIIGHGECINLLLEECQEDHIILLEEDCFVLKPSVLDPCFKIIEQNKADVVGSTRGCATNGLIQEQNKLFNLHMSSPEHQVSACPHLWPSFLFTKRQTLLNTDRHFGPKTWQPGETVKALNYVCKTTENGDTFVATSIELRAAQKQFAYVHQHHAGAIDITDFDKKQGIFAPNIPWIHFGSLSSACGFLLKDNQHSLLTDNPCVYPNFDKNTLYHEISRRIAIWKMFADALVITDKEIASYYNNYKHSVNSLLKVYAIAKSRIDQFCHIYTYLLQDMLF